MLHHALIMVDVKGAVPIGLPAPHLAVWSGPSKQLIGTMESTGP